MRKSYDVRPRKTKKTQPAGALARKGRKGDNTLVHMSRGEVAALDGIAAATGKRLTRNPKTGLAEAFNLKKTLKIIAPIVAGVVGGPLAGAATSALITKADGGSWNEAAIGGASSLALGGALGAGGKAISGAMADGALKGVAGEAAKTGLGEVTKTGLAEASSQALGGAAVEGGIGAVKTGLGDAVSTGLSESAAAGANDGFAAAVTDATKNASIDAMAQSGVAGNLTSAMNAAPSQMGDGLAAASKSALTKPAYADLSLGDKWTLAKDYNSPSLGLAALALQGQKQTMEDERLAEEEDARDTTRARKRGRQIWDQGMDRSQYHFAEGGGVPEPRAFQPIFDFKSYVPPRLDWDGAAVPAQFDELHPQRDAAWQGARSEGSATAPQGSGASTPAWRSGGGGALSNSVSAKAAKSARALGAIVTDVMERGQVTDPNQSWSPYQFAMWDDRGTGKYPTMHNNRRTAGDMQAMFSKGYAEGGHIQGPGDGMSDGIGALIDGVEPARIASGEYIIPADVVSHLGNGDTNAGVEYLNTQLAAIRKDSTGNPNQRKKIDPTKYIG